MPPRSRRDGRGSRRVPSPQQPHQQYHLRQQQQQRQRQQRQQRQQQREQQQVSVARGAPFAGSSPARHARSPQRRIAWRPQSQLQQPQPSSQLQSVQGAARPAPHNRSPSRHAAARSPPRGVGGSPASPSSPQRDPEPVWRGTADKQWEQICADARVAGIAVPRAATETVNNQHKLKRATQLLSTQAELDELSRGAWDEEYRDARVLELAMTRKGLSNGERLSLWCVPACLAILRVGLPFF